MLFALCSQGDALGCIIAALQAFMKNDRIADPCEARLHGARPRVEGMPCIPRVEERKRSRVESSGAALG